MPIIRFVKNRPELHVQQGIVLMKALLEAGLPVASSCHGDGVCGKCRLKIVSGNENLSPVNFTESQLRDRLMIAKDQRVSCQTVVLGDVVVDATYW